MSLLGIACPNPECGKEMLVKFDKQILCVACNHYFRLIPAELSVPGEN